MFSFFFSLSFQPVILLLVETSLQFLLQSLFLSVSLLLPWMLLTLLLTHFLPCDILYLIVDLS